MVRANFATEPRAILPACGIAIGKPLGSVPHLGRLEPDLIGEFFALETLRGDPNNPFAEPPHTWMPKAAWRASGSGMFDFVARAKQTFPDYPAIQQVDITVEGVSESWLLAAFAILARADNLTVGFGDASACAIGCERCPGFCEFRPDFCESRLFRNPFR